MLIQLPSPIGIDPEEDEPATPPADTMSPREKKKKRSSGPTNVDVSVIVMFVTI